MDRYQIAIKNPVKGNLFRFPSTSNISQILRYMDHCRRHSAFFLADNITLAVLETALVKASKLSEVPILVTSQEQARILSTVYSSKFIYSIDKCPPALNLAICYGCTPPPNVKSYITVYDKAL